MAGRGHSRETSGGAGYQSVARAPRRQSVPACATCATGVLLRCPRRRGGEEAVHESDAVREKEAERDARHARCDAQRPVQPREPIRREQRRRGDGHGNQTVSYTQLTLPTNREEEIAVDA